MSLRDGGVIQHELEYLVVVQSFSFCKVADVIHILVQFVHQQEERCTRSQGIFFEDADYY